MKRHLVPRRPSPAMVVALVALLSSLVGGATAATLITGADIKDGTIAKRDLKRGAVRSPQVKDGSLLAGDFRSGQIPAGATGPAGPRGPAGGDGAPGAPGAAGANGADGAQGPAGQNGQDGDDGAAGAQGSPDTASQVLNKLVTVDGTGSELDADLLDGLSSGSYGRKVASSTLFIGFNSEAYDDPGECVNQFFTNIGGLELGDQVVASITRNGSELSPPVGLLSSAWIVERDEAGVEVPRILVRFCNVTPGVIESVGLNIRATVYR